MKSTLLTLLLAGLALVPASAADAAVVGYAPNHGVRSFAAMTGATLAGFPATGDVATGFANGDTVDDFFSAEGNQVLVRDGKTLARLRTFAAFDSGVTSMRLAVGDVTCDGKPDVVVSAHAMIRVYDGTTLIRAFFPFGPPPQGSELKYLAAVGDVDGDCRGDVITASGDVVSVYSGLDGHLLRSFHTGLTNPDGLAAGDVTGDGLADPIVGASGRLRAYDKSNATVTNMVVGTGFTTAVVADADGDKKLDLVVGSGATVKIYDRQALSLKAAYKPWGVSPTVIRSLAFQRGV